MGKVIKKKINGFMWTIEMKSATDAIFAQDRMIRGCVQAGNHIIYLSDKLTPDTAMRVIVHEVTHAFLFSTQMRMPEEYAEEELCEFVALWCIEILKFSNEVYFEMFEG